MLTSHPLTDRPAVATLALQLTAKREAAGLPPTHASMRRLARRLRNGGRRFVTIDLQTAHYTQAGYLAWRNFRSESNDEVESEPEAEQPIPEPEIESAAEPEPEVEPRAVLALPAPAPAADRCVRGLADVVLRRWRGAPSEIERGKAAHAVLETIRTGNPDRYDAVRAVLPVEIDQDIAAWLRCAAEQERQHAEAAARAEKAIACIVARVEAAASAGGLGGGRDATAMLETIEADCPEICPTIVTRLSSTTTASISAWRQDQAKRAKRAGRRRFPTVSAFASG